MHSFVGSVHSLKLLPGNNEYFVLDYDYDSKFGKVWKIYSEKHVYQSLNDWYTASTIQITLGYSVSFTKGLGLG